MPQVMWKNGRLIPWEDGKTHVINQGLHYGCAIFEGIRFYETDKGPAIFRLPEHLERFFLSASVLKMKIPFSANELAGGIKDLIKITGLKEGYIRPIAWFADEKIGLNMIGGRVDVAIAVLPWDKKTTKTALDFKISPFRRIDPRTTNVEAKIAGHYVNTHLALCDAIESGFDDAILLDTEGFVAEASASNVFIIKGGFFVTPPPGTILNGITRNTIGHLAVDRGYMFIERKFMPNSFNSCSEAFICGTAWEVMPIATVDGRKVGNGKPGEITKMIMSLYANTVRGRKKEYLEWLTHVY